MDTYTFNIFAFNNLIFFSALSSLRSVLCTCNFCCSPFFSFRCHYFDCFSYIRVYFWYLYVFVCGWLLLFCVFTLFFHFFILLFRTGRIFFSLLSFCLIFQWKLDQIIFNFELNTAIALQTSDDYFRALCVFSVLLYTPIFIPSSSLLSNFFFATFSIYDDYIFCYTLAPTEH